MPLVLVQNPVIANEGFDWKDIEGEQYHFPNQYKNRCVTGTPFVYYRGQRRPDRKRAVPEYFGTGRIGDDGLGSVRRIPGWNEANSVMWLFRTNHQQWSYFRVHLNHRYVGDTLGA
jgi:hypothetical protein